jgi:iron complex outermembrane receptor protein
MKLKNIVIITFCLLTIVATGQNSLKGKVVDFSTAQSVPGAVVFLPQLNVGATSDSTGHYAIKGLPKGNYTVEVQLLGYTTITKQVNIDGEVKVNFTLFPTAALRQDVVITALGNITTNQRSPVPVDVVSHDALLQTTATNVVDAIATQPGVTAVTTGPGVSKPEVRGLGFNRVLTTFDGVRQEDFQWGDEHGIQIDPYAVYDAEIIRGPASLQYGSDAVGGVVSFKSAPFPESGTIQGSILTEYQTNNGLIGSSFNVSGNNNGVVWDARGSENVAHCYQDPKDGYVWGTAYNEYNGRFTIGLNRDWGYSHFTFSALKRTIEIPDGNRDSATGEFAFDFPINGKVYPDKTNFLSYNPTSVGYQQIEHDMVSWQNSLNIGSGHLMVDVAYSMDHREEIDSGSVAALNMNMFSVPYSVKYQVQGDSNGFKLTAGVNGMYEQMNNAPEAPAPYVSVFLVPSYSLFDAGGFGILEKDYKKLTLSGGVRYDTRHETGESLYLIHPGTSSQAVVAQGTSAEYTNFPGFKGDYDGVSGCLGASYLLPDDFYVKANLSRSYRAPAITQVGENGIHPGTNNFEIGDPNLKPEAGNEADLAFGYNGGALSFEADGFYNNITNFIFASRLVNKAGEDSLTSGYPTFKFAATDAVLEGVDAYLNIHPSFIKWLELDNGFTYVYSVLPNGTDSTRHVPFTPAPRLTTDLKLKLVNRRGIFSGSYIKLGLAHYWAQNDIYSANLTELPSVAYTLFNVGFGTNLVNPKTLKTICMFYVNVTNLGNLAYYDHTSRTQYFLAYNNAPVVVTNPAQGIYNMGRNIGFKLVFPIGIKNSKADSNNG